MKSIFLFISIFFTIYLLISCSKQSDNSSGREVISEVCKDSLKLTVQKENIINEFIKKENKNWRIAKLDDNKSEDLKKFMDENPGYHPYYLQADLSHDGIEDFVVVVVKEKDYGIVWFHGKQNGEYTPQWLTKNADIKDGGLFLKDSNLLIGACFYCDNAALYIWDNNINNLVLRY